MVISKRTTETHLSQVDFFRGARIFLRIFGIWPMDDGKLPVRFYINYVSLFFAATFGVAHGFVNLDNLFLALESFCGCIFEFISWGKLAVLYYYRNDFGKLLRTLLNYFTQDYGKEEIKIYRKAIVYSTVATILLASGGFATCTCYVITPIVKNTYYYFTKQPLVKEQPFNAVYPFIDHYSDKYFLPCYLHLTHGGYCTATVFNGIDSIFMTACFHISAQFQITTLKIKRAMLRDAPNEPFTMPENQRIRQQLIEAIEEQIKLFAVTDLFIKVFTAIILMHFTSVALIIGIGSIDLLMAPGAEKTLYIFYIVTVVIQSFAYAYSGNQINEYSLEVSQAAWDVDWHYLDGNNQQIIRALILRSQLPKYVKVPFFEVTLTAYTKIMSTAGSYITLLNNMLNK